MHVHLVTLRSFRRPIARFAAATAILLVAAATTAEAKTITVMNGHDHGPGSLRAAIANAVSGDTIDFATDVATVTLKTAGLRIDAKDIAIKGRGAKNLTIRRSAKAGTPEFTILAIVNHTVKLSGLTIANGLNPNSSGGISVDSSTVTISGCAITGNKGDSGGGIGISDSNLTIKGTTISGNSTTPGFFAGGGLLINSGKVNITRSTIAQNSAASGGGGIFNEGHITITNSTVASNSVTEGSGGGIWNYPGTAEAPKVVRLGNTIVAQNTDAGGNPDFRGELTSLGFNLIGNTAGITGITGDTTSNLTNVDPLLGELEDNGGATKTKALLAGSPAIDKGNSGSATQDQRRFPRPVDNSEIENAGGGDASDIGAFEVQ